MCIMAIYDKKDSVNKCKTIANTWKIKNAGGFTWFMAFKCLIFGQDILNIKMYICCTSHDFEGAIEEFRSKRNGKI